MAPAIVPHHHPEKENKPMLSICKPITRVSTTILGLTMACFASDFSLTFDGPFLKSFPGKTIAQYTQDNLTTSGYVSFTADWTTGKVGSHCFIFNGNNSSDWYWNNQWARVDNHPTVDIGLEDFSIEFWVKTTATKTNNTIIDKRQNYIGYHVTLYNGAPLLQMTTPALSNSNYYLPGTRVNDGHWHKVQFFVDRDRSDGGKLYIDGMCTYTFNPIRFATASISNGEALWLGRHLESNDYNFEGSLDDLRIWKK
jgi:hypothetical protein